MITVYTKPGCPACVGTMRYLERHGLEYRTIDISQQPHVVAWLCSLGYRSLPVVTVGDEHWSGLKIDRLNALVTNVNDSAVIGP